MFVLPDETVRKIISGEESYDYLFRGAEITEIVRTNEIAKGYKFEDQARVNSSLGRNYNPMCTSLEAECLKNQCALFKEGSAGKIKDAWVCREYKIDFPDADFDSRYHVAHIGTSSIDVDATLKNIGRLMGLGGKHICLGCHKIYEKIREERYEDGHNGRMLQICTCGSDLFEKIGDFLARMKKRRDEKIQECKNEGLS